MKITDEDIVWMLVLLVLVVGLSLSVPHILSSLGWEVTYGPLEAVL
jgi:hypothetical protein